MGKKTKGKNTVIAVCTGDACADKKAKKLRSRLKVLVEERGLEDQVAVKKCGCVNRCSSAPVVEVSPGSRTFKKIKPKKAEAFLDDVLGGKSLRKKEQD